jgi:hypothetical protein
MNEKMAAVAGLAAGGGRGRASGESGSVAREVQAANKEISKSYTTTGLLQLHSLSLQRR